MTYHAFYVLCSVNWNDSNIRVLYFKNDKHLVSKTLPDPANPRKVEDNLSWHDYLAA